MKRISAKATPVWFRRLVLKMTANLGHVEAYFVEEPKTVRDTLRGSQLVREDGERQYLARVMAGGVRMMVSASSPADVAVLTSDGTVTLAPGEPAEDVGAALEALGKASDSGRYESSNRRG